MSSRFKFSSLATRMALIGVVALAIPFRTSFSDDSSTVLGGTDSASGLTTHVVRSASDEVAVTDLALMSHLGAHLMAQVADARFAIEQEQSDKAATALQKARRLAELLRATLPTTQVRTTVRDRDGKTVYQDVRNVQNERIAVMDSMVQMEILQPVREALLSEDEANTETTVRHTRMFLQLGYAERRLAEAERLLADKPAAADRSLRLLLANGVELETIAQHRPLADARDSLWAAQWATSNENYEEARTHLLAAQAALDQYGEKLQPTEREQAAKLRAEIKDLAGIVGGDGNRKPVVPRIKQALGKVRRWFDLHKPLHYDDETTDDTE